MHITLNQQTVSCPEGISLDDLLAAQGISSRHIAIALNQTIIKREAWASTVLQEGDSLLIIGAIKGG